MRRVPPPVAAFERGDTFTGQMKEAVVKYYKGLEEKIKRLEACIEVLNDLSRSAPVELSADFVHRGSCLPFSGGLLEKKS